MKSNNYFMQRCFQLAQLGFGKVAPNPVVGAVIVHNGKIIGEGFHQKYGEAHAEVNAVNSVEDSSLLKESTIFVSLEPCAHFGKTPPCADLLVKHQFKKVVISCKDTFSEVSGKGIRRLQEAGIDVEVGVLEEEGRLLNKRFFTYHEQKRPYVILKWAQSRDGFMDKKRSPNETGINWITQPSTKQLVHKWRAEEAAILVGKNTAINDNPSLTVRNWPGNNPVRILLDSNLEVPLSANLLDNSTKTIVFNTLKSDINNNIQYVRLKSLSAQSILSELYNFNIQSVIIEGGFQTLHSFISSNLWDEARVLTGDVEFQEGVSAPKLDNHYLISRSKVGIDRLELFENR